MLYAFVNYDDNADGIRWENNGQNGLHGHVFSIDLRMRENGAFQEFSVFKVSPVSPPQLDW